MEEHRELRELIMQAVAKNMDKEPEEAAGIVDDVVMDAISENFRSLTEIQSIVVAVRAGHRVQIAYADPEEDDFMDPYVVRPCW